MKKTILIPLLLIATGLLTWYACEEEAEEPPIGQTNKINFSEISATPGSRKAEISYSAENIDLNDVNAIGICYNTAGEPSTDDNTVSLSSNSSGTKTITGLSPDTKYHFRLYFEIGEEAVYSVDASFITNPLGPPVVSTHEIIDITATSASCSGNITDNGGFFVSARGVCWSTSQTPTINDNSTSDGSGMGSFTSELTGLTEGTTYYVRAYATNETGTAYGDEKTFTVPHFSGTFTDSRDGQTYEWVRIGNQVWMAENLNYDQDAYGNDWCYYNNSSNCDTYGRLYNWAAVMQGASSSNSNPSGVQGVCPDGWHVPSDEEWKELEMQQGMSQSEADNTGFRGTNEGSKLAGNASLWNSGILTSNSVFGASGFTALPGGGRNKYGNFFYIGSEGNWWSSTENSSTVAWDRGLDLGYFLVNRYYRDKSYGFSVRCVRDD